MALTASLRAWLLLVPLIPSLLLTIFNLFHLLSSRALRTALNNHTIIVLLSCGLIQELTDTLWYFYYLYTGKALSTTHSFCSAWVFLGSSTIISIYFLMAWASIERHILIFHTNWFGTKPKRFFFHYLPMIICVVWPIMFYFVMFFIVPCNIPFIYTSKQCLRYACVYRINWVALWDSMLHYIVPTFVTVFFSLALLVRVLYHRYRVRRRIDWRNYKKMAAQLLPISLLYICLVFPPMVVYAFYSFGVSITPVADYYYDSLFFCYWAILFTPFVSSISLPELQTKFRRIFLFWRRRDDVRPQIPSVTRPKVGQIATVAPIVH